MNSVGTFSKTRKKKLETYRLLSTTAVNGIKVVLFSNTTLFAKFESFQSH
jgi:hypothetical protein